MYEREEPVVCKIWWLMMV